MSMAMHNKITALGWCTVGTPIHEHVFRASVEQYVPHDSVTCYSQLNQPNFGAGYNELVKSMIAEGHTTFAICNDDIVLRPDTWNVLQQDWQLLKTSDKPEQQAAGILAARHDYVRMSPQNIRFDYGRVNLETVSYPEEQQIINVGVVSPILAVYSAEAWIDFPEINWFSDDVQCWDIRHAGHTIWVSRAYCHHIGSMTMGHNYEHEERTAVEWLKNNRPDFYERLAQHRNAQ